MFTILGADGKEYGPVSADKIAEWIRGGRANLQTRARREGELDWKMLGEFPEFATTPVIPSVAPAPASPMYAPGSVIAPALVPLAGRGARLVARIIDWLISSLAVLPGLVLLIVGGGFNDYHSIGANMIAGSGLLLACLGFLVLFVVQVYLLSTSGQTLGKKLMDVRVVNFDDGKNPGFVKVFLLRAVVNGLISCVPALGGIYGLVDICFIFRDDRRCIHDFIAGTVVVKA